MKTASRIKVACAAATLGLAMGMPALAADQVSDDVDEVAAEAQDAWREGKLDTIYLMNRHLNNFTIDPEVTGDTVVLTGKVESDIDSDLAEEIAQGMDGIETVENRLEVVPSGQARNADDEHDREFSTWVEDATLVADVKMQLLANSDTHGLSIDVDAKRSEVVLSGTVKSSAEKELAGKIAGNVEGVRSVDNRLEVKKA